MPQTFSLQIVCSCWHIVSSSTMFPYTLKQKMWYVKSDS